VSLRFKLLGSGSEGNATLVEGGGARVLLDAGLGPRQLAERLHSAGVDPAALDAVFVSHEHGDHARGAARLARRLGVPILTAPGTRDRLPADARTATHLPLGLTAEVALGPFTVRACPTSHDAAEPLALAVHTADGARVGVAYDLGRATTATRYLLRGLTAIVLEANHDDVLLRTSGYPPVVQQRIAGSGGHLSNRAAAELLAEVHHPGLSVVVLAHLSERCNTAAEARAAVETALRRVGFRGTVYVAEQDAPLPAIDVRPGVLELPLAL
jgi:phosphoribosyl 1,2-cyclic phosphodiesterase